MSVDNLQSIPNAPHNYRLHRFHLFNKNLMIAAMARPNYIKEQDDESAKRALESLKGLTEKKGKTAILGFYKNSFAEDAQNLGFEYHHVPLIDSTDCSTPTPPETYNEIYETIKKLDHEGKTIILHCGAGDGRTGTVLAALKLRELMIDNPELLEHSTEKTTSVFLPYIAMNVKCTPLVKMAIESIRELRFDNDENQLFSTKGCPSSQYGSRCVEEELDVRNLENYESHLRKILNEKKSLVSNNSPTVNAFTEARASYREIINTQDNKEQDQDKIPGSNSFKAP